MSDADGADWPPLKPAPRPRSQPPGPKAGDRVRITVTGRVVSVQESYRPGMSRVIIEREDGKRGAYYHGPRSGAELEILEPGYVHGGVYKDAGGEVMRWTSVVGGGWLLFGQDRAMPRNYPTLPVERIDN